MSVTTEGDKWMKFDYPYDAATCGKCLSMHGEGDIYCKDSDHKELRRVAKEQGLGNFDSFELDDTAREKFLAIRKLFAHLYPHNPVEPEIAEPVTEEVSA